jgi:hypothetical protein
MHWMQIVSGFEGFVVCKVAWKKHVSQIYCQVKLGSAINASPLEKITSIYCVFTTQEDWKSTYIIWMDRFFSEAEDI